MRRIYVLNSYPGQVTLEAVFHDGPGIYERNKLDRYGEDVFNTAFDIRVGIIHALEANRDENGFRQTLPGLRRGCRRKTWA